MKEERYLNHKKKNKHEEAVRSYFEKNGYQSLARGWPDFVFFTDDLKDIIFVEVKRPNQTSIKPHQDVIRNILIKLGCNVRVAFGVNEDGSPRFEEIKNRKIANLGKMVTFAYCPQCGMGLQFYETKPPLVSEDHYRCFNCDKWFYGSALIPA